MCVLREKLTHRGSAFSIENFQDQKRKKETALYELKRLKKSGRGGPRLKTGVVNTKISIQNGVCFHVARITNHIVYSKHVCLREKLTHRGNALASNNSKTKSENMSAL